MTIFEKTLPFLLLVILVLGVSFGIYMDWKNDKIEKLQEKKEEQIEIKEDEEQFLKYIGKSKTYKITDEIGGFDWMEFVGITSEDGITTLVFERYDKDYHFPYSENTKTIYTFEEEVGDKTIKVKLEVLNVNKSKGEITVKLSV